MRNRQPCPHHPDRNQYADTGVCLPCFRLEQFTAPAPDPADELEELAALGIPHLRKLAKQRKIEVPGRGATRVQLAAAILGIDPPPDDADDQSAKSGG